MKHALMYLTALVLLVCAFNVIAYTPIFDDSISYDVSDSPWSVCIGDFNEDAHIDLAVANDSGNISILMGVGDGTFVTGGNYEGGNGAYSVCVGDFDEDGHLDIAVANRHSDNISILMGVGDGTFIVAVNYSVDDDPTSICTGDFDEDGHIDLAVTNEYSDNVSILLGIGDGTFASAVNYEAGYYPFSVCTGDFNEDGYTDLAVANIGYQYGGNVSILIGVGDGTFSEAVHYNAGDEPWSICAGDFDEDGHVDLAVANENSDDASILLGAGDGTFAAAVNYDADDGAYSICIGDFNEDGNDDLAVANQNSANVSILLGGGDGTFRSAQNYSTGILPHSVCTGDFNEDGLADLVVANNYSGNVSILCNSTNYSPSLVVQCPGDIIVPAFTNDPYVLLSGFQITNASTIGLSFDYYLVADGPAPLVDNGNPASIFGRTPLLLPGESFSPPLAALQLVVLREYAQEEITYVVTAVDYPEISESCITKLTFEPPIATFLQSYSVDLEELGIKLKWTLCEMSEDVQWFILRLENADGFFKELDTPGISKEHLSFTFQDRSGEPGRTYKYRVDFSDEAGRRVLFETDPITIPSIPLTLLQNHPNPFNPSTTIKYYLPENCSVLLEIFDVSGKRVACLVNEPQEMGQYVIDWNGQDQNGNSVSSGTYFYRLKAGKETISKKMVLLR